MYWCDIYGDEEVLGLVYIYIYIYNKIKSDSTMYSLFN